MSSKEVYCMGARVWVRDATTVWREATLRADYVKDKLTLEVDETGEELELTVKEDCDLPPLRNPDILIGENDLTSLSYLHEPAVLYNLRVRFCNHGSIYTYCGIVLVAINPYEELPIYGSETIWTYRGKSMGDLDPHIFAVAEEAYTKMERVNTNQAIIVSGESGAGKTVSAKYAMRYFATVGGSAVEESQIEKKVLASNPIMEAIGNAKTIRNDNSSRFGKFIKIDFNKNFNILAANMRTYLLEKSRVVFQAADERNYHIFYQLCSVRDRDEFHELELGHQDDFFYLNQGESPTIDGVDDARCFEQTRQALTLLGLERRTQTGLFRTLAAVLHLGNVEFKEEMSGGEEACSVSKGDRSLPVVARLLNVDHEQIRHWICKRKIVSMRETFTKSMNLREATSSRDALAKHIYAQVFSCIVSRINKCLETREKSHRFIGVLDIYGFETFETNSFEQFCINYANEKLQQQFNQHVFKLEQEEYVKEKIEWTFIDFYDNQPCIDLIETRLGILDLLDEECRMPKGSDQSWVEKLYDKCGKFDHFEKPRLSRSAYVIAHFADKVQYESTGFLEKNRDTVLEEQINVLRASLDSVVSGLFAVEKPVGKSAAKAPAAKGASNKKTVGSQFRDSLRALMATLNSTTPHYVRCIKPNDQKEAFGFEPHRAVQQLRACGVLETIRISAAGYPSRWLYQEFFYRYRVLCKTKDIKRNDMQVTCENILSNLIKDEDKFKFGRTKIFFRAGQVAYMEKLRSDRLRACGIMIQKHVRGWLHRKRYHTVRGATCTLQRWVRGYLARRRTRHMRRTAAAVLLQSQARGLAARRTYQRLQWLAIRLQARARGGWARQRYQDMRRQKAAIAIQRHVRGFLARRQYARQLRQLVLLQSCVRRLMARRQLKALKIEAKSIDHQKKLNKGLENKIISLQQRITELTGEHVGLKQRQQELDQLTVEHRRLKAETAELRRLAPRLAQLEAELAQLREQFDTEKCEKVDLVNEKDRVEREGRDRIQQLNEENEKLRQQIRLNEQEKQKQEEESKELFKTKVDLEKSMLNAEHDQERLAYQRLLQENARLEQRNETLEGELKRARGGKTHQRSSSSVSGASEATTEAARDDVSDLPSLASDLHDEQSDVGYGSVRSHRSDRPERKLENIEWEKQNDGNLDLERVALVPETKSPDVSLVLKLQQRVKEVEADRQRLEKRLEELEHATPNSEYKQAHDQIRLQDLEMETAKQKSDLQKLRQSIASGSSDDPNNDLMMQFHAIQDEVERRREECIQLRTVIANNASLSLRGLDDRDISEDGEVLMAFETQKQINRQLAEELHHEKEERVRLLQMEVEYRDELERLKGDNERQQRLISRNLGKEQPQEAIIQHEITRLTSENLDLREKIDGLAEQVKKYKKQLKLYAKKLKDMGASQQKRQSGYYGTEPSAEQLEGGRQEASTMPVIRHKSVDYVGMFEYKKEHQDALIRSLIYDLRPKTAVVLLPGLPAYILFMCIRHTDHVNDDEKVRRLLTAAISGIKRVVKKRRDDADSLVMWLANVCRLLHSLKQYSGEAAFRSENTEKQNEQCLKNFDLSEYRQVLSDVAMWIYQLVIKLLKERLQPVVVPAVLEHEAIAGLTGRPAGVRGRAGSNSRQLESPVNSEQALDELVSGLKSIYRTLAELGVDPEITVQVFKQLFYTICAHSLNNLLLRKELCHWTKGMQIRYNLSHLEQWCRDNRLHKDQETGVIDALQPIIQAAQLLQARKTEDDVTCVCNMCNRLTTPQIIKILNLYTPDEYEERVPITFIRKVQEHLQKHRDPETEGQAALLMDTKFAFPVRFPFNPSNIRLEDIEIPDILNLSMLKKL